MVLIASHWSGRRGDKNGLARPRLEAPPRAADRLLRRGALVRARARYLRNNYATLKTLNPKFPFLVRAAEDKPYVVATYGMGHTETRDLDGLDEAAVERTFEELVALGEKHPRSWPAADDLPPDIVAAPGRSGRRDPA